MCDHLSIFAHEKYSASMYYLSVLLKNSPCILVTIGFMGPGREIKAYVCLD